MSLERWSYVGMLAFCLAGTLPLIAVFRLRALRQLRRLVLALVVGAVPFVVWDVYATAQGQWRFDAAQTLPWRVLGLPLEELAFFVVVPLAAIITFETVRVTQTRRRADRPREVVR